MGERNLRFFIAGLLLIILIGLSSAASCSLQTSCSADNSVLRLSDITNAHGEEYNQANYAQILCCDFTGTHTCSETNKVLGLSDITNAHAEIPSYTLYTTEVCFGDLECTNFTSSCDTNYPIEMVSLYQDTNSHLAEFSDLNYNVKICCKSSPPPTPVLYWGDMTYEDNITTPQSSAYIPYSYKAIAENVGAYGTIITFNIIEKDPGANDDIWTGTSVIDADGKARLEFIIDSGNLTKAIGSLDQEKSINDGMEFYFNIGGSEESSLLNFTYNLGSCDSINICNDYTSQGESACNADACAIGSLNCPTSNCICLWDDATGICNQVGDENPTPQNNVCIGCIDNNYGDWCDMPAGTDDYCDDSSSCAGAGGTTITDSALCTANSVIGWCTYLTNDSLDPLGCEDDGYLTYNWYGNWGWNAVNAWSSNPDGNNFTIDPVGSGIWRYHPINETTGLRADEECIASNGTNNVLCPAQIQLPFFGTGGILLTIALIVIIYLIIDLKKKKKGKKKK